MDTAKYFKKLIKQQEKLIEEQKEFLECLKKINGIGETFKYPVLETKWGLASVCKDGYYRIVAGEEEFLGKLLHRLIYEAYYGYIPEGYVVHHIDGNPLNNQITNLMALTVSEHISLHKKGQNHHFAKYTFWNNNSVHYDKLIMYNNNEDGAKYKACFRYKFNGWDLPIGYFVEFISPEIIGELVKDAIDD